MSETIRDMISDTLPIPCANAKNGREMVLFKEPLERHEEIYIFRNINCAAKNFQYESC